MELRIFAVQEFFGLEDRYPVGGIHKLNVDPRVYFSIHIMLNAHSLHMHAGRTVIFNVLSCYTTYTIDTLCTIILWLLLFMM